MSKIALSGNASGTGTLTIAAPNTSTDRTLTLPDQTGTLLTGSGAIGVNSSAATNSLVIDSSGNVGIGTSSPSSKFQVAGDVRINTVGTATTGLPIYAKQTNNDQRGIWTESATTDSNGRFYCDNSVVGIAASYSSTGSYLPITFTTSATERARIDSSGNLLVGTTSAGIGNNIGTTIESSGLNNARITVNHSSAGSSNDSNFMQFGYGGSLTGRISQSSTASVAYVTSSDYRLKENIQPMMGALAKVALLKPVTYTWKLSGEAGQGFIAHELAEVCPQAVAGEKDAVNEDGSINPQGIDTSFLVATLTAAIQELKAIVDAQGAEIAALKGTA